ncbi:MAG: hypothetical protein FJY07_04940 [Bacteroidetes bacterium]|nr:hypothetical protein [Bacteroidota bacterium]
MPAKKIAQWRNLILFEGSNRRFKVVDHKDKLIYGFRCKSFKNGLSIIWSENYSGGEYKNLTKEIIFELLKSGVEEVYTDDKQTNDMMTVHKKILSELPYAQVIVKKYDSVTDTLSDDFSDIFDNRNALFRFTWNNKEKKRLFEDEMNDSFFRIRQEFILKELINDGTLYDWDEFFDLKKKVLSTIPLVEVEEAYLKTDLYDSVASLTYEYQRWYDNK